MTLFNPAHHAVGVDIGGTSVKVAVVDIRTATVASRREQVPNPAGKDPASMAAVISATIRGLGGAAALPVGVGFPGIIREGRVHETTHLSSRWRGVSLQHFFSRKLSAKIAIVNDADAACLAEMALGTFDDVDGLAMMTTLGTGIGTALVHHGVLIPGTEFGHLHLEGPDFESRAAFSAVRREKIDLAEWTGRLNRYYRHLELLLSPELFVLGGAAAHVFEDFAEYLDVETRILPARAGNDAGIVGAALCAA
jgi:polyphosphate glucokinase